MKRYLSVFLLIISMLSLFACSRQTIDNPVTFYYMRKDFTYSASDDVVAREVRDGAHLTDIRYLLTAYLDGPEDQSLDSPYPSGTKFVNAAKSEHALIITLSNEFASLTGVKLTLACCCLAKTVMDFTGETTIQIQTESGTLDGEASIMVRPDTIVLYDTILPSIEEQLP